MSYIKSYLNHARRQSREVKNIHSVVIASTLTGIFCVVYLYLVRDIKPDTPDINMSGEKVYYNNATQKQTTGSSNNLDYISNLEINNNKKSPESNADNNTSIYDLIKRSIYNILEEVSSIKKSVTEIEYIAK